MLTELESGQAVAEDSDSAWQARIMMTQIASEPAHWQGQTHAQAPGPAGPQRPQSDYYLPPGPGSESVTELPVGVLGRPAGGTRTRNWIGPGNARRRAGSS